MSGKTASQGAKDDAPGSSRCHLLPPRNVQVGHVRESVVPYAESLVRDGQVDRCERRPPKEVFVVDLVVGVIAQLLAAFLGEDFFDEFEPWLKWKVYDVLFALGVVLLGRRLSRCPRLLAPLPRTCSSLLATLRSISCRSSTR